jgi:YgiT-type zinc finger domain-containing protein
MTGFDIEAAKHARRERIANRPTGPERPQPIVSAFSEGARMLCPIDGGNMVFNKGLTHFARVQPGLLAVANLAAFVCQSCGERSYDPSSLGAIQESMSRELAGMGIRAKLSKLARNNIGIYLPQDLQRHLGVEAGDALVLQPVGRDFLLVQIERQAQQPTASASKKRRFVLATEMFTTRPEGVEIGGLEVVEGEAHQPATRIEGKEETPLLKRSDKRRSSPTTIRTDEVVPAASPTASVTLVYGGGQ